MELTKEVLIHCISWNAFGDGSFIGMTSEEGLNPLYIVECFRRLS